MKQKTLFLCALLISFLGIAQVFNGPLILSTQSEIDNFNFTQVTGQLTISESSSGEIENVNGLSTLVAIGGGLLIDGNTNLTSLDGLDNLISVGSTGSAPIGTGEDIVSLQISNNSMLNDIGSLSNLSSIGSFLEIEDNASLPNLNGLEGISTINGNVFIRNNNSLLNLEGLNNITQVTGNGIIVLGVFIENNDMLLSLSGLNNLTTINPGGLSITNNNALISLNGLSSLETINAGGSTNFGLNIISNDNLNSLDGINSNFMTLSFSPLIIAGNNSLSSLSAFSELTNLTSITSIRILDNDNLLSLEGLENITSTSNLNISGNDGLESLAGLNNLTSTIFGINGFRGDVLIRSNTNLQSLDGLNNLSEIGVGASSNQSQIAQLTIGNNISAATGEIFLGNVSLTSIAALSNLTSIEGTLSIFGCSSLQNLNGLENITNIETLVIGDPTLIDNGLITPLSNLFNDALSDFCAVSHLVVNSPISEPQYFVANNAFNPTFNEIAVGICSSDSVDTDGDGIFDSIDNCPQDPNLNQANNDDDEQGDICDTDDDNDGVDDIDDAFPFDPTESSDFDNDGTGDNADTDDDNDGFSDEEELECGSDPLDANETCDTLRINDINQGKLFTYPNPVENVLMIENTSTDIISDIKIYSLEGRLLFTTTNSTEHIDFSRFSKGMYFIKITINTTVITKRVIKR